MTPRRIRVMPADVALKIAAGEVVERPASAVKELLDNAIDAGARQVKVDVQEGGLKLIRVSDDGHGIPRDDLLLAFTSHATSKITDIDDLDRITTLGFRGEALPSIAAVSRVDIQSRVEGESTGSRLRLDFGQAEEVRAAAVPVGSRISISELFANVPARRKFVRSVRAETGRIQHVISQYALAHPDVRFSLAIDGRIALTTPGSGRLSDAVAAIHGASLIDSLLPVETEERDIRITGLTGDPSLSRPNRTAISIFVNGRPITNRSLGFALEEAYSGFLMTGRHPIAVIHLHLSADDVDVNVHPSKSEVRFAREREVHGVLHRAIANVLLEQRLSSRPVLPEAESITYGVQSPDQPELAGANEAEPETATLMNAVPALRVFGQTNQTYILAEGPSGLFMIDQHAAHERVLFDRLDVQMENGAVAIQPLLAPLSLDLTPGQMQALEENRILLEQAGFQLSPFGDQACLIRGVPAMTGSTSPGELVIEVLDELERAPEPAAARERALAAMACRAAVKAGQTLDVQEMRELVQLLESTLRPSTCPHGRPTMIHLSHSQLEREFGRR